MMRAETSADVLSFQLSVLKVFGLVELTGRRSSTEKLRNYFCIAFGSAFITGSVISNALIASYIFHSFSLLYEPAGYSPFLYLLTVIPPASYGTRGISVFIHALYGRNNCRRIIKATDTVTTLVFGPEILAAGYLLKWKKWAVGLGVLTLVLGLVWDIIGWWYFIGVKPGIWEREDIWEAFPMKMTMVSFMAISELFCSVPFYISQQVFVMAVVLGWMFSACIKQLVEDVHSINEDLRQRLDGEEKAEKTDRYMRKAAEKVIVLKDRHARLVDHCEEFNGIYSWVFFWIYFLDMVTTCGYIAAMVMNLDSDYSSAHAYNWSGAVLFGVYTTGFLMPVVGVDEHAHDLTRALYRLHHTADHFSKPKEGKRLKTTLSAFINASRDQVLFFHGADLFRLNRHLLVTTGTIALSTGIISSEILAHTKCAPCPVCSNSTNSTDERSAVGAHGPPH